MSKDDAEGFHVVDAGRAEQGLAVGSAGAEIVPLKMHIINSVRHI